MPSSPICHCAIRCFFLMNLWSSGNEKQEQDFFSGNVTTFLQKKATRCCRSWSVNKATFILRWVVVSLLHHIVTLGWIDACLFAFFYFSSLSPYIEMNWMMFVASKLLLLLLRSSNSSSSFIHNSQQPAHKNSLTIGHKIWKCQKEKKK